MESTPERSFSDLFRSSRAADAMTECGPELPRCAVFIMAFNVASIGRFGSTGRLGWLTGAFEVNAVLRAE